MKRSAVAPIARPSGFTLIELLVVVAIIALLISILLPSLSRARAQARTAVCASRISQLAKAILLYADDYNDTPPFIGRGWEDCDDDSRLNSEVWPEGSGHTLMDLARFEDWLMPNMPDFWLTEQVTPPGWPDYAKVTNGGLFRYARFEGLYLCPEFERISDSSKSQFVFNYTRSFMGRKWFHHGDPEGDPPSPYITSGASNNWCGIAGPILKTSQIYAPARLWMLIDERWDRHCAAPMELFQVTGGGILAGIAREQWMAIDCIWGPWGNEIGQYHGSKRIAQIIPEAARDQFAPVRSGNMAFYDGHVALDVDPLPDRTVEWEAWPAALALVDWLGGLIFAQRGLSPDQIVFDPLF